MPLVLIAVTASCTAAPAQVGRKQLPVATWTDTLRGGAYVQALTTDPATGTLIELQSAPSDPAQPDTSAVIDLDPATGRQVWSTLTGDEVLSAVMPYKDLLAIATGGTNGGAPPSSVWVLDAGSGTELRSIDVPGDEQAIGLAGGSIITANISNSVIFAFLPVSGREIWHRSGYGGCPIGGAAAGSTVVGVLVNCPGNEILLIGADPATGRELWSRPVDRNFGQALPDQPVSAIEPVTLTADGHLFGVSSSGTISLYTAAGRLVDTESAQSDSQAWFTIAGSQALLIYESPTGDLTVKKINIATRATRTLFRGPYVLGSAAFADGVAYISATAPAPLLPTLLIALNEGTASFGVFALPFAGPATDYSLATNSDEVMLFSGSYEQSFVAAYRFPQPGASSTPRILGGAPGKWPDACSLVSASEITRLAHGPYVAVPRTLATGAGWPDASTCEFVPGQMGLPLVTLSVAWRAPGMAQALQLLRSATSGWTRLEGVRDPGYEDPGMDFGEVLMRVGTTIVEVEVSGTPQAQNALAVSVARQVEAGK